MISVTAPPLTTLATLKGVARTLGAVTLESREELPDRRLEIERSGEIVRWHVGAETIAFPVSALSALERLRFEWNGNRYVAIGLTFTHDGGPRCYRLINSHETDAEWLRTTLSEIACLLGMPITERDLGDLTE
jgi:hypothetical protein